MVVPLNTNPVVHTNKATTLASLPLDSPLLRHLLPVRLQDIKTGHEPTDKQDDGMNVGEAHQGCIARQTENVHGHVNVDDEDEEDDGPEIATKDIGCRGGKRKKKKKRRVS